MLDSSSLSAVESRYNFTVINGVVVRLAIYSEFQSARFTWLPSSSKFETLMYLNTINNILMTISYNGLPSWFK